jgi:hypothetical protein
MISCPLDLESVRAFNRIARCAVGDPVHHVDDPIVPHRRARKSPITIRPPP